MLYTDSAVAGEAAGLGLGLLLAGTASDKAQELLAYAHAHLAKGVRVAVAQAGIDVVQAGLGTLRIQQAALDAAPPPGSAMPADAVPVPGLSVLIWFSNATSAPISD